LGETIAVMASSAVGTTSASRPPRGREHRRRREEFGIVCCPHLWLRRGCPRRERHQLGRPESRKGALDLRRASLRNASWSNTPPLPATPRASSPVAKGRGLYRDKVPKAEDFAERAPNP